MQQTVGDQLLVKQRRDILLQAQLVCIDVIRLKKPVSLHSMCSSLPMG